MLGANGLYTLRAVRSEAGTTSGLIGPMIWKQNVSRRLRGALCMPRIGVQLLQVVNAHINKERRFRTISQSNHGRRTTTVMGFRT